MNRNNLRTVIYGGQKAYFHQWIKKTFDDEQYRSEHSYALIELEDGNLIEVSYSNIRFQTMNDVMDSLTQHFKDK